MHHTTSSRSPHNALHSPSTELLGVHLTCLDPVPASNCTRNVQEINITNCDVTTWSWVNLVHPLIPSPLKNAAERREWRRFRVCKRSSLFLFTRVVKSCFHIQNDIPARTRMHARTDYPLHTKLQWRSQDSADARAQHGHTTFVQTSVQVWGHPPPPKI